MNQKSSPHFAQRIRLAPGFDTLEKYKHSTHTLYDRRQPKHAKKTKKSWVYLPLSEAEEKLLAGETMFATDQKPGKEHIHNSQLKFVLLIAAAKTPEDHFW